MIPGPVKANAREAPVTEKDYLDALNREVIPTLRQVRAALNQLLEHLGSPPAVTGSRADPEQALAAALTALDALGIIDDTSTV